MRLQLSSIGGKLVVVNSFTQERISREIVIEPDVGVRWGKPSQIDYSSPPSITELTTISYTDEGEHVNGIEVHREYQTNVVAHPDEPARIIEFEGIKSVLFSTGQRIEWREEPRSSVMGSSTLIDIVKVIVNEFLEFQFPGMEQLGGGTRGDAPADPKKPGDSVGRSEPPPGMG